MRSRILSRLASLSGAASLVACGASQPRGVTGPSEATDAPMVVTQGIDAGAGPTTTIETMQPSVGPGAKLTPIADARKPAAEPGRGVTDIQAIVVAHRDEARACYDSGLAAHPGIEGSIDLRWTIDPNGVVTEADIDGSRSEIMEASVGACLVGLIKKVRFNASAKGFETKTHYPFNFHPRSRHATMTEAPH